MFPTSVSGTVELASIAADRVPELTRTLKSALERARASQVTCRGNVVVFRVRLFRLVSNWNVLVAVGSGVVEVRAGSPGIVRFRFSCVRMLVLVSVLALLVAAFIPPTLPLYARLGVPFAVWVWFFGMNFMLASFRLPAFVRRAILGGEAA
jgi:hypothetical protein